MIACYAQPGEDIPGIAVHWLKNYFSRCTGAEAELNETRLRALLTMHQVDVSGQNPWDRLREIGLSPIFAMFAEFAIVTVYHCLCLLACLLSLVRSGLVWFGLLAGWLIGWLVAWLDVLLSFLRCLYVRAHFEELTLF